MSERGMVDKVAAPDVVIEDLGGCCPVQGEGTVNGHPFYFRARGNRWAMGIGGEDPVMQPLWYMDQPYGDEPYAAGYMPLSEAEAFIRSAAAKWAEDTTR